MHYFGIDFGCTSIKHGRVTLGKDVQVDGFDMLFMLQSPGTDDYVRAITGLIKTSIPCKAVGIGFPSVVWTDGILNLDIRFNDIWDGIQQALSDMKIKGFAINDADAAGIAEVYREEAKSLREGVTLVLTLGTGVGSALFCNGEILRNTELGMLEMHGAYAEKYMAASIKHKAALSLADWAGRLQEYLSMIEILISPDHIVIGGGISADYKDYQSLLSTKRATLQPAYYRNQAGVIGAALHAAHCTEKRKFSNI